MRFSTSFLALAALSTRLALGVTATSSASEDTPPPAASLLTPEQEQETFSHAKKYEYQSDIARLMKIVVGNLYESRDVWVRELLSNANDALEKTRLLSLTDPAILEPAPQLNVSVITDVPGRRIIIRDSGLGMTQEQLAENLGTIARSGTSEFLAKLDKGDGANLIGQFGLGFYSSFLVADRVTVASKSNDSPKQYVFESNADAQGFRIAEDPRGTTLGRGTEITLHLKEDAKEYLEHEKLKSLISKHAEYGASPIYLWTETTTTYTEEEAEAEPKTDDDSEVKVEDVDDKPKEPKTKEVTTTEWQLINDRAPLWMRDPKEVTKTEYEEFFKGAFKSSEEPLAWSHFKGDAGPTSFRALIFIPPSLPNDFYSKDYVLLESLKLFVRRVFITNDLGKDYLPRHLNWVKVFIDVDDLPLNVGRDSLQKTRVIHQIKANLIKRILDTFASLAEKDPEKYNALIEKAGTALKVGVVEDLKNRDRLVKLLRFHSSASDNVTSLHDVVMRRRKGQNQLFFIAAAGAKTSDLAKSPFVERILARGYEVLYMTDPMDEMGTSTLSVQLVSTLPTVEGLKFQDVAKEGLKFGDEDEDEDAKEEEESYKTQFEPLAKYIEKTLADSVEKVVISTRLTTSPCLVVAGKQGYSGNMERLIASQNQGTGENFMTSFAKMQKKTFEINPKHPLIEALLTKVEAHNEEAEGGDDGLKESLQVLWLTALVKSGFTVPDPNVYFEQIETILRRSLGVAQEAKVEVEVKPAPEVEHGPVKFEEPGTAGMDGGEPKGEFQDWAKVKAELAAKKAADAAAAMMGGGNDAVDEEQTVVDGAGEPVTTAHDEL
ncbi:BQ5605_C035g11402 [Microbotryum silenes-dioicae]|uniref:BQ5605_C035g11402 protein n=1 Tax=Microbotryum silenes-dioicae TaxID=796604 RepID=A0A2X0PGQ5_9BASI|nr:BQ5605_C035g11402 [Microbotryum silenes-dioicae]